MNSDAGMAPQADPITTRAVGKVASAKCGAMPSATAGEVTMKIPRPVPANI